MAIRTKTLRVAMASQVTADNAFGSFRGVLDYKEHAGHWQMVGKVATPIASFEALDLSDTDGVVGFYTEREWADRVREAGVASVNISVAIEDLPLPRVGIDDPAVGRMGAKYLLERGFAHFAFVGNAVRWYSRRRLAGFREVIENDARLGCHVFEEDAASSVRSQQFHDWVSRLPKPVAIMAASDALGCETITASHALGLRIPYEVAVLGVDNDRWLTQFAPVALSSVEPDWQQVGYRAAELLDELMEGKPAPAPRWIPPLRIVTRASTDVVLAEDPVVSQALQFIRDHCGQPIGVEHVIEATGVSRRHLETRMKRSIGKTPYNAICHARVEQAKTLLTRTDRTLADIARRCGMEPNQFYPIFKRLTGLTPNQYRRRFPKLDSP